MAYPDPFDQLATMPGGAGDAARADVADPPQILETPNQTAQRQAYENQAQDRLNKSVQLVKAKDLAVAGVPTYSDTQGNTQPVTDAAGMPVTQYDKRNNVGWDSLGNPVTVDRSLGNDTPAVRDAFADIPITTDKKTGNQYKVRPGLPWQWAGQDDDIARQNLEATKEKAVNDAAASLGRKLTLDERQLHRDTADYQFHAKELGKKFGLDGTEDFETATKKISDSFNNPIDGYAAPQANEKQGWFSGGPLTPEAATMRADLDKRKADALATLSTMQTAQQTIAVRKAAVQQAEDTRNALLQQQVDVSLAKAQAAGVDIPTLANSPQIAQQAAAEENQPDPIKTAVSSAVSGQKAYDVVDGKLKLSEDHPLASIQQAVADGLIPQPPKEVMEAAAQKQQLIDAAGRNPKIKAALAGAGRGAAFMATAPLGAGVGAAALSETGPGAAIGGLVGGLITGSLGAYGYGKVVEALGAHNETINSFLAAQKLHPGYAAAGELATFGAGLPKALMKGLGSVAEAGSEALAGSSRVEGATSDAIRATVRQTRAEAAAAAKATGGTATIAAEATPDIAYHASSMLDAIGKAYASSGGGLLNTIKNLTDLASTATAQKGPAFAAAQVAKRVAISAAGMVTIDTALKEGSKALGFSDEGQTLSGVGQAALLGAFASGHGIEAKGYSSQDIGDIVLRGMAHDVTGTPAHQPVDMGKLSQTPDIGVGGLTKEMTRPLTPEEQEIYSAFNQKAAKLISEGKLPTDPGQWTARAKQILFAGRTGGVANVDISGKEAPPEPAPSPGLKAPPVAEQMKTAEAKPSPVETPESLQAEKAAILAQKNPSEKLKARVAVIDAKLANLPGNTSATPAAPTPTAPAQPKPKKSAKAPTVSTQGGGGSSPEPTPTAPVTTTPTTPSGKALSSPEQLTPEEAAAQGISEADHKAATEKAVTEGKKVPAESILKYGIKPARPPTPSAAPAPEPAAPTSAPAAGSAVPVVAPPGMQAHAPQMKGAHIVSTVKVGEDGKNYVGPAWNTAHKDIIASHPDSADAITGKEAFIGQYASGKQVILDRKNAMTVAKAAGQVRPDKVGDELHSQDLVQPGAKEAPPAEKPKSEFSSTQVNIPEEHAKAIRDWLPKNIPDSILAEDGHETEPHITALFGLHADAPDEVQKVIKNFGPVKVKLGKISVFKNDKYDVVKVGVESPDLHRLNGELRKLDHTSDYPDYQPHMTLAYVKPGEGAQFEGRDDFEGREMTFNHLTFSGKDRTYIALPLGEAKSETPNEHRPSPKNPTVRGVEEKPPSAETVHAGANAGDSGAGKENPDESGLRGGAGGGDSRSEQAKAASDPRRTETLRRIGSVHQKSGAKWEEGKSKTGLAAWITPDDGILHYDLDVLHASADRVQAQGGSAQKYIDVVINEEDDHFRDREAGKVISPEIGEAEKRVWEAAPEEVKAALIDSYGKGNIISLHHAGAELVARDFALMNGRKTTEMTVPDYEGNAMVLMEALSRWQRPAWYLRHLERMQQIAPGAALAPEPAEPAAPAPQQAQIEPAAPEVKAPPGKDAALWNEDLKDVKEAGGDLFGARPGTGTPEFYKEMAADVAEQDTKQKAIAKPDPELIQSIKDAYRAVATKSNFPTVSISDVMEKAGFGPPTMELGKQHLMWMWQNGQITAMPFGDWSTTAGGDRDRAWGVNAHTPRGAHGVSLKMLMPRSVLGARPVEPAIYNAKFPPEKSDVFLALAKKVIRSVDTPENLALFMTQLGPKGPQYSQQMWYALKFAGADGPSEPKWPEIYAALAPEEIQPNINQDEHVNPEPLGQREGSIEGGNPPIAPKPTDAGRDQPGGRLGSIESETPEKDGGGGGASESGQGSTETGAGGELQGDGGQQGKPAAPEPVGDIRTVRRPQPPTARVGNYVIQPGDITEKFSPVRQFAGNTDAIKILKEIESSGRAVTLEDQQKLAKYVGWGGMKNAFNQDNPDWKKRYDELKSLLTPEEYAEALSTINDAHYTSPDVVGGIYNALTHFGFPGGKMIEGGVGIGNFIGLMPEGMRGNSNYLGNKPDSQIASNEVQKADYQRQIPEIREVLKKPFEKQAELEAKRKEHAKVRIALQNSKRQHGPAATAEPAAPSAAELDRMRNEGGPLGARPVTRPVTAPRAPSPEAAAAASAAAAGTGQRSTSADAKAARDAVAREHEPIVRKMIDRVKAGIESTRKAFMELKPVTSYRAIKGEWLGAGSDADTGAKGLQRAAHDARMMSAAMKRAVPNPLSRMAISRFIEAEGDMATLRAQAATAKPKFAPVYERAMNLTAEERKIADTAKTFFDEIGKQAVKLGILSDMLEGYVAHFVDISDIPDNRKGQAVAKVVGDISTGRMKTRFDRSIRRVFKSMFDLEQEGYHLQSSDIAEVMAAYAQEMNNVVAARTFVKKLTLTNGFDGRPLGVTSGYAQRVEEDEDGSSPLIVKPFAKPQDARDFLPIDHPALRKYKWAAKDDDGNPIFVQGEILIHPEIHQDLSNTLGTSALNKFPVIRAISEFQGIVKNMMLSWSLFHFVQEGTHAVGHGVNPFKLHTFDMENPITRELVNAGLLLVNWDAKRAMAEGLAGKGGPLSKIPYLGPMNEELTSFLFEQYIPGLKSAMAHEAFLRNLSRFKKELDSGKITRAQVAQKTAQQANDAFGGQNTRYEGKNPTTEHAEHMAFLAPDFLKSRMQFFADAFTKHGTEQRRALFILAAVLMVTAKLLEKILTGKNDWKKPFSVTTDSREYELRSVPGDVLEMLNDPRRFFSGRLSPIVSRSILEGVTGRDYRGTKRSGAEQLMDLIKTAIPMSVRGAVDYASKTLDPNLPKSIRGVLATNSSDISGGEQVASAMGVRTKRYSEITQARILGHKWQQAQGLENPDEAYPPSKYIGLKDALEDGNLPRARAEYSLLVRDAAGTANADAVAKGFRASISKPFSGSASHEPAFVASLDKSDRELYNRAVMKRNQLLSQFALIAGQPKAAHAKVLFQGFA